MSTTSVRGFHTLPREERLALVKAFSGLSPGDTTALTTTGSLTLDAADIMTENVIGTLELPLSVATNFRINTIERFIPMAIEESSVVAAASYAAKLSLPTGFRASADRSVMKGMVQLVGVAEPRKACADIAGRKEELVALCRNPDSTLVKLGGGVFDIAARTIETKRGAMVIVDIFCDCKDAMGANTVNTAAESLAPVLENITGGKRRLMILSNLADRRLARAEAVWKRNVIGDDVIEALLDAQAFAESDPYRCSTQNKGIMNGIDAVALATGNDFRALEAGAHAYASRSGRYESLTHYEKNTNGDFVGRIELPIAVGVVGGSTTINPVAKAALKILGAATAQELAISMAAVGLAQNFAALRAQVAEGIQKGHMKLHAKNLAVQVGASGEEIEHVSLLLVKGGRVTASHARSILEKMRQTNKKRQP